MSEQSRSCSRMLAETLASAIDPFRTLAVQYISFPLNRIPSAQLGKLLATNDYPVFGGYRDYLKDRAMEQAKNRNPAVYRVSAAGASFTFRQSCRPAE